MPKHNFKLYIMVLVIVLGILILLVSLYASRRQPKGNIQTRNIPSPTPFVVVPTLKSPAKSEIINITPRFTGANEDIPQPTLSAASQKQRLKKNLPINTKEFSITYDYSSDLFVVVLAEPKSENKTIFMNWLKENYPLLTLNKFLLK